MARDLYKQNGKWMDRNNGNQEFKGHVTKDMGVGDRFERAAGWTEEITSKIITPDGGMIVGTKKV